MRSRLPQIIAGSIGPDGKVDKAALYTALQLTPDSPEALLIDAYCATEESIADFRKNMAAQAAAMKGLFDGEAKQLQAALQRQLDDADAIKDQLAALFEDVLVKRVQLNRDELAKEAGEIRSLGKQIAEAAEKVAAHTRREPFVALAGLEIYLPDSAAVRTALLLVGGFLAGLIAAFAFVLTRWR